MSTRAMIRFYSRDTNQEPDAHIYRHTDGYVDGLGMDILNFLDDVAKLKDTRFNDPSYLAAKWVVWDAMRYVELMKDIDKRMNCSNETGPLDFLSIGIMKQDAGDAEYYYDVICGSGEVPPVYWSSNYGASNERLTRESEEVAED